MALSNVNIGGFILANDYYSWSDSLQNQYRPYIIFDISTDEIIVDAHSFGL